MTTIQEADAIRLGSLVVDKVYLAGTQVWPPAVGIPSETMFGNLVPESQDPGGDYTMGVYFTVINDGWITHARYFNADESISHKLILWQVDIQYALATIYGDLSPVGWREAEFPSPVEVFAGIQYCSSYSVGNGLVANSSSTPASLTSNLQVDGTYYDAGDEFMPLSPASPYNYHADVVYQSIL